MHLACKSKFILMKNQIFFWIIGVVAITLTMTSCEEADSDKEWGLAKIYMPQANYSPYIATTMESNKTCEVDTENNELRVYLGAYRTGLETLDEFSVDVVVKDPSIASATELPSSEYTLPSTVTCSAGERNAPFYLIVNLSFLEANADTDYTLTVSIQNPNKYELNEELSTVDILINYSQYLN